MNKTLFTLVYISIFLTSFNVLAAETITEKSILDSFLPSTKNCNYVDKKLYQPFSKIDSTFPGANGVLKMTKGTDGKTDCINVSSATENIVRMVFTVGIIIIIILTVISISISGIQYMTEEATGQIKGGARKRLTNSFIALGLGLLSYTILYTINKQLVEFSFDPGGIDKDKSIQSGAADAKNAFASSSSILLGNVEIINPQAPLVPNSPFLGGTGYYAPSWNEATTIGNFSTYASYGSIKCSGSFCSSSNPTVFGYMDGDGTVGNTGDNGIGNAAWSTIPGCTYDNWNTTSMGVALPQGFWRAAGVPLSEVKYIGIKVFINGSFVRILPVVDDSQSNLDFTFAAAKMLIDPTITNSNRLNTKGKQITFEIVKNYYKTNPKTNVVWISNKSTFSNRIPCNTQ